VARIRAGESAARVSRSPGLRPGARWMQCGQRGPAGMRDDLAAADLVDFLGAADQRGPVCYHDAGDRQLRDQVGDDLLVLLVEIGGAFVEKRDLRIAVERARE